MGSVYFWRNSWYLEWTDEHNRRRRKSAKTKVKKDALQQLANLEKTTAQIRCGIVDSTTIHLQRPITDFFDQYIDGLIASGRDPKYVNDTRRQWRTISGGWTILADLNPTALEQAVLRLSRDGMSARTQQRLIGAANSFARWLLSSGYSTTNPFARVKAPRISRDRRLIRRPLLPAEWPWLKRAAAIGQRYGVTRRDVLYQFAIETGYRVKEIRQCVMSRANLSAQRPYIELDGRFTKNGEPARQFITQDLAQKLCGRRGAIFDLCYPSNMARMLRADLAAAYLLAIEQGPLPRDFLQPTNIRGEVFDFHSLRHTCGTWLCLQGVNLKVVQAVMRHSSIQLTADTYGHLFEGQVESAVDRLSGML